MRQVFIASLFLSSILLRCNHGLHSMPVHSTAPISKQVDSIVVIKNKREMQLYSHQKMLAAWHVCLGPEPVGAKHFRDDGKTPEGIYYINGKNPNSHYHKCLGLSYPSAADVRYATSYGKQTGGDIKIHGLPNGKEYLAKAFSAVDWTLGCIALTDDEIDELYAHVATGAYVNILP